MSGLAPLHEIRLDAPVSWGALPQPLNETARVSLEPRGSRNGPALHQFDLRLQQSFDLSAPRAARLELILDVFNLFNSDSGNSQVSNCLDCTFRGEPAFGLPRWIIAPRQAQLGVRMVF